MTATLAYLAGRVTPWTTQCGEAAGYLPSTTTVAHAAMCSGIPIWQHYLAITTLATLSRRGFTNATTFLTFMVGHFAAGFTKTGNGYPVAHIGYYLLDGPLADSGVNPPTYLTWAAFVAGQPPLPGYNSSTPGGVDADYARMAVSIQAAFLHALPGNSTAQSAWNILRAYGTTLNGQTAAAYKLYTRHGILPTTGDTRA